MIIDDFSIETRRFGNIDNIFDCSVTSISTDLAKEYISEMEVKFSYCNNLVTSFIKTDFNDQYTVILKNRAIDNLSYMQRRIAYRKAEHSV